MRIDNNLTGTININNNNGLFPFPIKNKADLLIEESDIIWEEKRKSINFKIENKGIIASGGFHVTIRYQEPNKASKTLTRFWISQIEGHKTVTKSFNLISYANSTNNYLRDVEKLIIKVDDSNRVKESNEKNNIEVVKVSTDVEMIKLSTLYPPRQTPLKVNFYLERLKIIEEESWSGEDEPFLWVYGIHIDCKTLQNDDYIVRIPNPGHQNIGGSLDEGKSTYIPANVGHISIDVHELPFIGSITGIVVVVIEEDTGPTNHVIELGYERGIKYLNETIKELKEIKKLKQILMEDLSFKLSGDIDYSEIISNISSEMRTKIKAEMHEKAKIYHWYDVMAIADQDDTIGVDNKFVLFNELTKILPLDMTFKYNDDYGDAQYKITGSISTETFPTIDKLVKNYEWTSGWSSVAFYQVNNQLYLFLLKEIDGTVHIHKMNSDGTVGDKVEEHDWTSGWSSVTFYEVNNKVYLFLLKKGNGIVNIHEMGHDGKVGKEIETYDWSSGWSSISFYEINNKTYLFLLKKDNGIVHIHEMNSDGIGEEIENYDWSSGWSNVSFYVVNNKTYLFSLKKGNGIVHIHEMDHDGKVGKEVEKYNWTSGWDNVEFYTANNKVYLLLSKLSGTVHIHQMNNDGTVGRQIDIRHWSMLKETKIFNIGFRNYLFINMELPFIDKSFVNILTFKNDNRMSYNNIKGNLKYGDIVLFSGDSTGSGIIQISTLSKWSHVGIVYQEASNHKDVLLLEAVPDDGVRLINLGDKIENYQGQVSIRILNINRTPDMQNQLKSLYNEIKGRSYESLPNTKALQDLYNRIKEKELGLEDIETLIELKELVKDNELAKAAFDMLDTKTRFGVSTLNHRNLDKLFCSELVAEAYQRMGLLPLQDRLHPSNEYVPNDFSACESLPLLKGELLEEIAIK